LADFQETLIPGFSSLDQVYNS